MRLTGVLAELAAVRALSNLPRRLVSSWRIKYASMLTIGLLEFACTSKPGGAD